MCVIKKFAAGLRSDVFQPAPLIVWAIVTVILAVTGPFDTYNAMNIWGRGLYWFTVVSVSHILAVCVRVSVSMVLTGQPRLRRDLVGAFIFSMVFTPFLYYYSILIAGSRELLSLSAFRMWGVVLIVALCITLLRNLNMISSAATEIPRPRLLDRIDGDHDADSVVRLTVNDHYVEVRLTSGVTHRLLMRFTDAVAEMAGTEGFCVHRSHWVARAHIGEVIHKKGRFFVCTSDGAQVPVGPKYRVNLVAANFLNE